MAVMAQHTYSERVHPSRVRAPDLPPPVNPHGFSPLAGSTADRRLP